MLLVRFFLRRQSLILLGLSILVALAVGMVQSVVYRRAHSISCDDANGRHHPSCHPGTTLLLNGRISLTGAPQFVEALAVAEGRVLRTGTSDELRRAFPGAEKIDLNGQLALPGFHDVRVQMLAGGLGIAHLDLRSAVGLPDFQERIATHLRTHPEDPWIFGQGWSVSALGGQSLNRRSLDALSTTRPLFLWRDDFRAAGLNSKALELLSIRKDTPDTYLGRIERDRSNLPTGVLEGEAAEEAFRQVVRLLPTSALKKGLLSAQEALLAVGITRVGDQQPSDMNPTVALQSLVEEGLWRLRVTVRPVVGQTPQWPFRRFRAAYPAYTHAGGAMTVLDGSPLTRHAALSLPYPGTPGQVDPRFTVNSLASLLSESAVSNPFLLAEGDQALKTALAALDAAPEIAQPLVTSMVWSPDAINQAKRRGVFPVLRPGLALQRWSALRGNIPEALLEHSFPLRALAETTDSAVISSSWPESPIAPLFQIRAALSTLDDEGEETMPEWYRTQALGLEQALAAYTLNPARAIGREADEGSLEPGHLADLVVLEGDLFGVAPERIETLQVVMTIIGGEVVWRREGGLQLQVDSELIKDSPHWRKALARQHFWQILLVMAVLNWPLLSLSTWMWQRRPRTEAPRVLIRPRD